MSGMCALINFDGRPVEPEVLCRMAEAAAHRGPDGISYWLDGDVGLAYLALNITPESLRERQPLASEQGDLMLTADARVDNRDELIPILTAKGHLAKSMPTDADLILAAYRCWGIDCPGHLIGDFAFAIWDNTQRRLFVARDAMGMRTIYYRVEPRRLLLATEIKQILAAPQVPVEIFEPAVGAHLAGPYGRPEWTFYKGIAQLPPAHALVADATGHRTWRYWNIDPDYRINYADEKEYIEHFLEIFKEAVRCRLRSVKPVGIFLSGGLDSGSAASTAGWLFQHDGEQGYPPFRAYCWAFERLTGCDERHISDGIVRYYGFPLTNVPADTAYPLKDYPAHGPDRDEPNVGVYQALTNHTLAIAQAEKIGLMLTGDRGDEMVGDWIFDFLGLFQAGQWRTLWTELQAYSYGVGKPLSRVMMNQLIRPLGTALWPQGRTDRLRQPIYRMLRGPRSGQSSSQQPYPAWVRPEFATRVKLTEITRQQDSPLSITDPIRRQRYQRIFSFTGVRTAVQQERSQARFGLGFADPWSDLRIASFVLAVPQRVINRFRERKRLVRNAMHGIMPEEVRQAAGKIEPNALFERGFKQEARDIVLDLITTSKAGAYGYLDEHALHNIYNSYLRGEPQRHDFWWPLTLEMWLRQHWT